MSDFAIGKNSYEELAEIFQNPEHIGDLPIIARFKLPHLVASGRLTLALYIQQEL